MRIGYKIVLFSILLNLACGVLIQLFPAYSLPEARGGLSYDSTQFAEYTSNVSGIVQTAPTLAQTNVNFFTNLLDRLNLGIVQRLLNAGNKYMFGFYTTLFSFLNLENGVIAGIFKGIISLSYLFAGISLFTGREFGKY